MAGKARQMEDIDANTEDGHRRHNKTQYARRASPQVCTSGLPIIVYSSDIAMITASVQYISASANRFNRTAATSCSSLVAFGSGKFVALWDTQVSSPLVGAVV
jgi:hypothetical protein